MDIILSRVHWKSCLVYLNDENVFSLSAAQRVLEVDEILSLLKKAGVNVKLKKRPFVKHRVVYMGHKIFSGNLTAASVPTKGIIEDPFPTDKTIMGSVLGACNVYRSFEPKCTGVWEALTE